MASNMQLQELSERIASGTYEVNPQQVADSIISRMQDRYSDFVNACEGLSEAELERGLNRSGQSSRFAPQKHH